MFGFRHRLQEGEGGQGGGGGQQQQQQQQGAPAEWLKPFGEHAKAFEGIKDPAELATKWGELNTEVTSLKGKTFDWRKEVGGEDPEAQKLLARYTDPKAFFKAHTEAVGKIRSGELAKPLDMKTATPEQVKEWRTANGIPAEVKGYFENLPQGLVIGKTDQGAFDRYGKIWHDFNIPPAAAHAMAKAYYEDQEAVAKAERKLDDDARLKVTGELRTLWGKDYDANEAITSSWLDGLGKEGKAMFMDAILPNGERLWNNRAFREFVAKTARENNPIAHVIPGGGEGDMKSIETELTDIKKLMSDKNSKYWKGPESAKLQARYRDLISAQSAVKSRAA